MFVKLQNRWWKQVYYEYWKLIIAEWFRSAHVSIVAALNYTIAAHILVQILE
jgi:hypothetical protein